MKPMLLVLSSITCLFSSFVNAQSNVRFDSLWIYEYYKTGGFTTVAAINEFVNLEKENHKKNSFETDMLNKVLSRAIVKRHFQTKLGSWPQKLFCLGKSGGQIHKILLVGPDLIIDFTEKKNYWIKNEDDKKWAEGLLNKVK